MALVHGSRGLIYFVHQFKPKFNEHALLDDPEMLAAVTAVNRQIRELAPVLNSPIGRGRGDRAVVGPAGADRHHGQAKARGHLRLRGWNAEPTVLAAHSRSRACPSRRPRLCWAKNGESRFAAVSSTTIFRRTECISIELRPGD